jgi:hypothetical protein
MYYRERKPYAEVISQMLLKQGVSKSSRTYTNPYISHGEFLTVTTGSPYRILTNLSVSINRKYTDWDTDSEEGENRKRPRNFWFMFPKNCNENFPAFSLHRQVRYFMLNFRRHSGSARHFLFSRLALQHTGCELLLRHLVTTCTAYEFKKFTRKLTHYISF